MKGNGCKGRDDIRVLFVRLTRYQYAQLGGEVLKNNLKWHPPPVNKIGVAAIRTDQVWSSNSYDHFLHDFPQQDNMNNKRVSLMCWSDDQKPKQLKKCKNCLDTL